MRARRRWSRRPRNSPAPDRSDDGCPATSSANIADGSADPAFLAEAEQSLFDVDPLTGEEMEQILARAYATPKELVQRAAEFNGSGAQ
jgi:hypothetical protein